MEKTISEFIEEYSDACVKAELDEMAGVVSQMEVYYVGDSATGETDEKNS